MTHGSDTNEEIAYLLNLTVKGEKAVVLVDAMCPVTAFISDAPALARRNRDGRVTRQHQAR
ncbi:asparaginase domain-containing protein [Arsenophonus endosymbiont of Aleurodicus floccissimus]|uniref:asparaginase domain-containing protein n=1 Tax=Arsenophonus endosymbiont of Aleurodicus floccissimus TaxID=2152761 RepID=UPI000E6AFB3C